MQPLCDITWRLGPEFSFSAPLKKPDKNIPLKDSWMKFNAHKYDLPLWGSWIDETILSEQHLVKKSPKDKSQISKNLNGSSLVPEQIFDDLPVRDDKVCGNNTQDQESYRTHAEDNQLVEEPWLLYSFVSHNILMNKISECKVAEPDEVLQLQLHNQQFHDEEMPLPQNMDNQITLGDPVSTVILINSSRCTMQRIAVLEDDKLVELLLEPVKNIVQCDSIYLGVVTKLVPHMGGAFVNIGSSRPSLMDIKHNRLPFVFPPFCHTTNNVEVDGFVFNPHTDHMPADDVDLNDDLGEVDFLDETVHSDDIAAEELKTMNVFFSQDAVKRNVNGHEIKYESHNDSEYSNDPSNAWSKVQKGSKLIVQVVKEGLGTKGPTLTAYPKLRSRFWILLTNCDRVGVSKKISGADRSRLRIIAKKLQPKGFGLTVRSVAAGHSLEELQSDLERLLTTWKNIMEHAKYASLASDEGVEGAVPVMLHQAMGQALSVVQDYFNENVKRMVVDSPRTYHEVTSYLQETAPNLCDRVELYTKKIPLFDYFSIEEEINNTLNKRVSLANGGSLVIEQTEALVSIDVNGGHGMFGHGTSQEFAILDVNLAAAKQIAKELRLRDIGGIIVVDFIDMTDDTSKRLLFEEMKKAVMRDRSLVNVYELSKHGLMEIIRKRVRASVTFMITEPCSCCEATGRVEAAETCLSKIEREICRLLAVMEEKADAENPKSWPRFILRVDHYMCSYLSSGRKTRLGSLSSCLKVWILLKVARGFNRGTFEVRVFSEEKIKDFPFP